MLCLGPTKWDVWGGGWGEAAKERRRSSLVVTYGWRTLSQGTAVQWSWNKSEHSSVRASSPAFNGDRQAGRHEKAVDWIVLSRYSTYWQAFVLTVPCWGSEPAEGLCLVLSDLRHQKGAFYIIFLFYFLSFLLIVLFIFHLFHGYFLILSPRHLPFVLLLLLLLISSFCSLSPKVKIKLSLCLSI